MRSQAAALWLVVGILGALPARVHADDATKGSTSASAKSEAPDQYVEERHESHGSIVLGGKRVSYTAVAGTLMVEDMKNEPGAMMSYVAYFRTGAGTQANRPITFLYNGGPGSATVWLHIGAFGPKRVVVGNGVRGPPAPYPLVDNPDSPLDVTDLVFIDAPGTGFGRIGVDVEKISDQDKRKQAEQRNDALRKDFYGVDQDARAFDLFITKFLTRFSRWNSPKFLFGESYGTTRSAVLVAMLQSRSDIDVNGVMLLSQILNFDLSDDGPGDDPGNDMPYVLSLPTYAATAWYHKRLPSAPPQLEPFLQAVENFALSDYAAALAAGDGLGTQERQAIAEKLHDFTGLPVDYIEKANLRVDGGMFEKTLLEDQGLTTGRLDTRYTGPTIDLLSEESAYDPQSAAITSAFVSVYNQYARETLGFPADERYKPSAEHVGEWDFKHRQPGESSPDPISLNVMPDLATAMKKDPRLKVALFSGYYDLATPFFEGQYEMDHLGLPPDLRKNIEIHHFETGHMVYVSPDALKKLHDEMVAFIEASSP